MAMKIQVKFFWVVMLCNVALGYQHFRGPCCFYLHQGLYIIKWDGKI